MWCGAGGLPQARVMRAPRRSFAKLLVTDHEPEVRVTVLWEELPIE